MYIRFSDRLQVDVVDGLSHWVDLTGCGQGIAVITLPTLARRLRLGPCYCGHVACYQFSIVNKGRRQQTVFATNTAAMLKSSKHHVTNHSFVLIPSTLCHRTKETKLPLNGLIGFLSSDEGSSGCETSTICIKLNAV